MINGRDCLEKYRYDLTQALSSGLSHCVTQIAGGWREWGRRKRNRPDFPEDSATGCPVPQVPVANEFPDLRAHPICWCLVLVTPRQESDQDPLQSVQTWQLIFYNVGSLRRTGFFNPPSKHLRKLSLLENNYLFK